MRPRKLTDEQVNEVAERLRAGSSIYAEAKRMQVYHQTLRANLRRVIGVEAFNRLPRSQSPQRRAMHTQEQAGCLPSGQERGEEASPTQGAPIGNGDDQ